MKTLIIHPTDPTTEFLKGIYNDLSDKTVITGGVLYQHLMGCDRKNTTQGLINSFIRSYLYKQNAFK
jgi:hypothetical protein